jgi:glutaminyl-peptide cyclotransferase
MLARAIALLAACAMLSACGDGEASGESADRFDAQRAFDDLRAQVEIGPRPAGSPASRTTARLIARRLRAAGATAVRIQRPHRNVVATLPGTGKGALVVGAHHDTKNRIPGFVGANDGASGVAVVLELARSLPRPLPGPTVHLALFDAEEARGDRPFEVDGTRGSRQYIRLARRAVRRGRPVQGTPALRSIRAMVLFDLVGDCDLQIPRESNSSTSLYGMFADAAESVDGDAAPFTGTTSPILDDHIPFRDAGVPAVDLIDFAFGPGPSPGEWFHTPEDTLDKVCPESLDEVGEAAVRAIPGIR